MAVQFWLITYNFDITRRRLRKQLRKRNVSRFCSQIQPRLPERGLLQKFMLQLHSLPWRLLGLLVLLVLTVVVLPQVALQRLVPPLGRGHLGSVPLPPLGPPVLEPNLGQENYYWQSKSSWRGKIFWIASFFLLREGFRIMNGIYHFYMP